MQYLYSFSCLACDTFAPYHANLALKEKSIFSHAVFSCSLLLQLITHYSFIFVEICVCLSEPMWQKGADDVMLTLWGFATSFQHILNTCEWLGDIR